MPNFRDLPRLDPTPPLNDLHNGVQGPKWDKETFQRPLAGSNSRGHGPLLQLGLVEVGDLGPPHTGADPPTWGSYVAPSPKLPGVPFWNAGGESWSQPGPDVGLAFAEWRV